MFISFTKAIFLFSVLFGLTNCTYAQTKATSNIDLSKYSYLLYGDIYPAVKPYGIIKATGFFVNYKSKTYLVTANHVLTGWNGSSQESYLPRTWYVRLYKNNSRNYSFFPLDLKNLVFKNPDASYHLSPDLCLYEMKIPPGYQVYTINSFIKHIQSIAISSTLLTYGYPPHYSPSKAISLGLNPVGSAVTVLTDISPDYKLKLENNGYDVANYRTQHYRYQQVGPGYSGSPVFVNKNGIIYFAGVVSFGNSELTYVVKPYWLTKILNQVQQ